MEAKTWNIDTAHSGINFSVRHMVFAKVRGRFGAWSGRVELAPQDLTSSSVEVGIVRDVIREVVLDAEYSGQAEDPWGNERAAFTATTSLNRGDSGLKWNQVLEAGGVLVGEHIDIELEVQAVKAAASQAA